MLSFLLDTDTVSYILRGQGPAASRLTEHKPSEVCISALTLAELRFGAERRRPKRLHRIIDVFIASVEVAPFDAACGAAFGRVQAALEAKGTPIGTLDTLIASHAIALNLTLVTNNSKHFSKVRGLRAVNWNSNPA